MQRLCHIIPFLCHVTANVPHGTGFQVEEIMEQTQSQLTTDLQCRQQVNPCSFHRLESGGILNQGIPQPIRMDRVGWNRILKQLTASLISEVTWGCFKQTSSWEKAQTSTCRAIRMRTGINIFINLSPYNETMWGEDETSYQAGPGHEQIRKHMPPFEVLK